MRLKDLKICFTDITETQQRIFFSEYYEHRNKDLSLPPPTTTKKKSSPKSKKGKTITLSPEKLALLQKLKLI